MPRRPRVYNSGYAEHIIQRGNNCQPIFCLGFKGSESLISEYNRSRSQCLRLPYKLLNSDNKCDTAIEV